MRYGNIFLRMVGERFIEVKTAVWCFAVVHCEEQCYKWLCKSVSMSVQLLSERVMANDSASPAYLASDWLLGII